MNSENLPPSTRRDFLKRGLGAAALASLTQPDPLLYSATSTQQPRLSGKAESCIFIWLGGGASQIDMFDPKQRGDGKKKAGSYYASIETAIPGENVCEHLKHTAPLLDRCVLLRTVSHDIEAQHGAATNLVHTGRKPSETLIYPSIGSIVSHQLGPRDDGVPPYVVMGYPNIARDPGFLGPKHGYVYLTQLKTGPNGFTRPPDVGLERQKRREALLVNWQKEYQSRNAGDKNVQDVIDVSREAFRMAGPSFMSVFNLDREPSSLRESYGSEFGQRCLLARRLVQSGVRFVEVSFNLNFLNGTGWDTHNEGQLKQHLLIQDLDKAFATLIRDLENQGILDKTLLVIATEFGRPAEFDSGGGRGHQSNSFTCVLGGGGLRTGQVIGKTDELSKKILERKVTLPDFHATIHSALGINPHKKLYAGDRPVPITDFGKPVRELFT
ncbi:MAG TPA: DUF1501 domain-containing protein [Verrucomicrobiales bacterium]|jgi:hypothetical protein|nr:DUF1501 domain-containing protein [Verrucomicrobiales bacterium]